MDLRAHLLAGQVIPAHPLALDEHRRLDERHQRALTRYYLAAGAGGVAVGVHTTQFAIREPRHGLLRPVLELAARTAAESPVWHERPIVLVAGACGPTRQAMREATLARELGYHAVLLSLAALRDAGSAELLRHCREVADVLPLFGFYLQTTVGGRLLDYAFWRAFADIENVVAIKIAPFDRYRTLDVVRAVADSGRRDIALYTGNDDAIVADLTARFPFGTGDLRIVGGLLGQWSVWTRRAVVLLGATRPVSDDSGTGPPPTPAATGAALTDANGAIFDARNAFAGCIAGIHDVLVRQRLMRGSWCLDPGEGLSPGQREEIDRVLASYPWLTDDEFVLEHLDRWLD
ncbi:MAG: dihydrodipicolinate synthase family protein [Gemmatimonadaceae bacterium]